MGRCADGSVGPKMPTTGVPTAAAMCIGPVSPEIMSAAAFVSDTRSATVVAGDTAAVPSDAATIAGELLFARRPTAQAIAGGGVRQGRGRLPRNTQAASACSATLLRD